MSDPSTAALTTLLRAESSKEGVSETTKPNQKTDGPSDENQLSQDLALFLANPSLRAALADGSLDLATYATTVQEELHQLESQCIAVYRAKQADIALLRQELSDCQSVLAALQEMLLGFQADLGGLSGDLRTLQQKSRTLDVQLKNRRWAEAGLRTFLQHVVLAPNLVQAILHGPVSDATFVAAVQELEQIYQDSGIANEPCDWSCNVPPLQTVAGKSVHEEQAQQLRWLAATRVREYFLRQLALLRRPQQTNIRMIQGHGLLKYAALQSFLQQASPELGNEIYNVYVESMSKTLQQLFRTYQAQLLEIDLTHVNVTKADVVALDDALLRDTLTSRAKKRVNVFCVGQRLNDTLEVAPDASNPILAHVALSENKRYPYEALFRSLLGHLLGAVTNEHVFCRQFFRRTDAFTPLFGGTLAVLLEQLENYLFGCYDALALLLMIKVTHSVRTLAASRTIHSLDPFLDQVTHLLWPRLRTIMEGHLRSLQQATAVKLGGVDLHAHYVSRRFAEFCCSLQLILHSNSSPATSGKSGGLAETVPTSRQRRASVRGMAEKTTTTEALSSSPRRESSTPKGLAGAAAAAKTKQDDTGTADAADADHHSKHSAGGMLLQDLSNMQDEFLALLDRLAEEHSSQKKRIVFLINNLDQVICIFQERHVVGKELNRFAELLMTNRELFVEEELLTGFSKMIAFVQQTEAHIASAPKGSSYDVNAQVVESLVLDFASNWKSNIEQINRNVLSYFSNFRNGMEILKQVLTQLLLYYTRFQDIIRKVWRTKPPAFCKDLVSTTVILAEIKKYALAI